MRSTTRRRFLEVTGTAAATLATDGWGTALGADAGGDTLPEHQPLRVPGVFAYSDEKSVFAGERIAFYVSSHVPVRAEICRLGTRVDEPGEDTVVHRYSETAARVQPIFPGSYARVERRLRGVLRTITLECWVRLWDESRLAGLISQEDKESSEGFALGIGRGGYVGFYLGDGFSPDEALVHRTTTGVVKRGIWHHVVARWNGRVKDVWVDGVKRAEWAFAGPLRPGRHPIRLGAMGQRGKSLHFLDGDLAGCVIYGRALADEEIRRRESERGLVAAGPGNDILGSWNFSEERGDRVRDQSGKGRHGRIINHGTWMIGGPSFDAAVSRFGAGYRPENDARRGHGLRLASDDLYDCRWRSTHGWRAPANARSGYYVFRLHYTEGGREKVYDCSFVVKRARRRAPAPILLVASTNTWLAYNGAPFGRWPDSREAVIGTDGLPNSPGDPPAYCLYRTHRAGQGTYQVGLRMPWPVASPSVLYGGATRYSHLMRGERFLQSWLESAGYEYELATDVDLHRDPGIFRRHSVVILNGHSEYWSAPALEGLESYLSAGGNLAVFSGNCLFWRVSFDSDCRIMECRKVDAPGDQLPASRRGECWHSHDGQRGGLLRENGKPGWKLVGMETLGWNNHSNPKNFGSYRVTGADHFLFHQPEETGLRAGDRFGHGPDGGLPLANGHEIDVRLSTLARLQQEPTPAGAQMPADPAGMVSLANGEIPWGEGGSAFDYFFRPIRPTNDQGGEMIYWDRPGGGRVFHAGSIGSGWALQADTRFQALVRNVLSHFGVKPKGR